MAETQNEEKPHIYSIYSSIRVLNMWGILTRLGVVDPLADILMSSLDAE